MNELALASVASIPLAPAYAFMLVLARVSGLATVAPIYGGTEVPAQARVLFAVMLAAVVLPTQWLAAPAPPDTLAHLAFAIAGELLIGFTLGWGVMLVFTGVQLTGAVLGQLSGMTLADVFNPSFDTSIPLFSQVLYLFALALFVAIGGHRLVLEGLLGTFGAIPPGGGWDAAGLLDVILDLLTESFSLGIRAAAPASTALLLATIVLGLISRTLPQLNVMALGFGISATVTLVTLALSLASIAWLFQAELTPALNAVLELFGASV